MVTAAIIVGVILILGFVPESAMVMRVKRYIMIVGLVITLFGVIFASISVLADRMVLRDGSTTRLVQLALSVSFTVFFVTFIFVGFVGTLSQLFLRRHGSDKKMPPVFPVKKDKKSTAEAIKKSAKEVKVSSMEDFSSTDNLQTIK